MSGIYHGLRSYLLKTPKSTNKVELVGSVDGDDSKEKIVLHVATDMDECGDKVDLSSENLSSDEVDQGSNEEDDEEDSDSKYRSNKKTDELTELVTQPSMLWRVSSGLYSTASGAVGMGVGSIKWAAGKSYNVGSSVVSHVKVPSMQSLKRKNKKE